MADIISAVTSEQIETIRNLFRAYEKFLQEDLCFQHFEAELVCLPGTYAPPGGALLLARVTGETAGCVAMRPLENGVCEMKRLYVRPPFLGQGVGRQLALAIIRQARDAGYRHMRLDTLERLTAARTLYRRLGFQPCTPYYDNPLAGVIFLELDLAAG